MELLTTPFGYQQEGIDYMLEHHYSINGDEMGLGKTLQALGLLCAVKPSKVLVVVPAYLKGNWIQEFKKHVDLNGTFIKSYSSKTPPKQLGEGIHIVSYSLLSKVTSSDFDVVIADECQYLKNPKSKRTIEFVRVIKENKPDRVHLLSGTPIKNGVSEFYSPIKICCMNPRGTSGATLNKLNSHFAFNSKFCLKKSFKVRGRTITQFHGMNHAKLPLLKRLLEGKYKRRVADKVLDLPELIFKDVYLHTKDDHDIKINIDEAITAIEEGKGTPPVLATMKKRSAILKAESTAKYALELLEERKTPIVIFTCHPEAALLLTRKLSEKVISTRVGLIDSTVPVDTRFDVANRFQKGYFDFLVATIGTGSTGFTLTASRDLIFNDKDWVPAENAQALKRVHRIGQERKTVIHSVSSSAVDEQISNKLIEKLEVLMKTL